MRIARFTIAATTIAIAVIVAATGTADAVRQAPGPALRTVAHEPDASIVTIACGTAKQCVAGDQRGGVWTSANGGARWRQARYLHWNATPAASSCAPHGACVMIGDDGSSGAIFRRAINGRWRHVATARPRNVSDYILEAVSCPSYDWCVAVGTAFPRGGEPEDQFPVSEVWNGKRWRVERVIGPRNGGDLDVFGVSCWRPRECAGVGEALFYRSGDGGVVLRMRHGQWRGRRLQPPVVGRTPDPSDISCWGVQRCMINGGIGKKPVGFRLARGKYRVSPVMSRSSGAATGYVEYISCHSAVDCVSGGLVDSVAQHPRPLAAQWDGRSWQQMSVGGAHPASIGELTCPPHAPCLAAAGYVERQHR